jgi:hypothetical protein
MKVTPLGGVKPLINHNYRGLHASKMSFVLCSSGPVNINPDEFGTNLANYHKPRPQHLSHSQSTQKERGGKYF